MQYKTLTSVLTLLASGVAIQQAAAVQVNWADYSNVNFVAQADNTMAATYSNIDGNGTDLTITLRLEGSGTVSANSSWVNWGYYANGLVFNTDFDSLDSALKVDFSFSSAVGNLSYTIYDLGVDSTQPHWQTGNRPGGFQDTVSGITASYMAEAVDPADITHGSGVGYVWQQALYYGTDTSSWNQSSTAYNLSVVYNGNVDEAGFRFGAGNVDGQSQSNPQGQTFYLGQFSVTEPIIIDIPGGTQVPEPGVTVALLGGASAGVLLVRRVRKGKAPAAK